MAHLRLFAINLAVLAALLIAAEGLAGYSSFVAGFWTESDLAERRHTHYDPFLGWSNDAWANIPDLYGPGVFLKTNGQGFRSDRDFDRTVPTGRLRIICSGDSFTLGYGVDNDHTWCHRLMSLDARLETVNMGQGGYGIDQAYLWYRRDGTDLEHQMQILAFITDDFDRVASSEFWSYGKPMLVVEQNALAVKNIPVPGPANARLRRVLDLSQRLHTVTSLRHLQRIAGLDRSDGHPHHSSVQETRDVVVRLLADLKRINDEQSSTLILVYLPMAEELGRRDPPDWMEFIVRESRALGIPLVTLLEAFDRLPPAALSTMFFQDGEIDYPGSDGHYTVAGNEFVAKLIYEKISSHLAAP